MNSQSYKSLEIKFTEKEFPEFDVEFTEKNDDVIYHFFPPNDVEVFRENFGIYLEAAFKQLLPDTADVRADYISLEEAQCIVRYSDINQEKKPTESFFVCVKNGANNPMVDYILKEKIFSILREELNGN